MPKKGYRQTIEHRAKISAKLSIVMQNPKIRDKLSRSMKQAIAEGRLQKPPRHSGYKLSLETRKRQSKGHLGQIPWNKGLPLNASGHRENCACAFHKPQETVSKLSWRMIEVFLSEFKIVIPEQSFGKYTVDAYLPEEHLAFEADGSYWHNRPGVNLRDKKRDAYLLSEFGLPIVRLTEDEINKAYKNV